MLPKRSKISKKVICYGKVDIGEGTVVEDNVILGNREEGELSIGTDSIIRSGTVIYSAMKIGNNFRSGHNVLIRENTEIGDNVLVGTNTVIDGDCRIGSNVNMQTGVYVTRHTVVEDGVFLGPHCTTINDKYIQYGVELRGPIIKKNAKVGANATIFPAVIIGQGAVVGAGAVVTKDVVAGDTVFGNPARSKTDV